MLKPFHLVGVQIVFLIEAVFAQSHLILFVLQPIGPKPVIQGVLDSDVDVLVLIVLAHVMQTKYLFVEVEAFRSFLEQREVMVEVPQAVVYIENALG